MSETSRRLLLLRHSKAEHVFGKADHERELTDRGHADARAIGEWLAAQGIEPDLVICSTATRTRQTWASAQDGGARADATEFEKAIYHGGVRAVVTAVQEVDPALTTVLVVGHEPTMSATTEILTEGAGAPRCLGCLRSRVSHVGVGRAGPGRSVGAARAGRRRAAGVCRRPRLSPAPARRAQTRGQTRADPRRPAPDPTQDRRVPTVARISSMASQSLTCIPAVTRPSRSQ